LNAANLRCWLLKTIPPKGAFEGYDPQLSPDWFLVGSSPSIMRNRIFVALGVLVLNLVSIRAADEAGFKSLFNGKDLTGWEGRPEHWSVEDGTIAGRTTKEHPAKGNNFLFWRPDGKNGTVSDFELRLSYKIVANNNSGFGNSGIQYRSKDFGDFVAGGYQADMEAGKTYSGILYEERMDGILAERGQKTVVKTVDGKTKVEITGSVGDSKEIQSHIKENDWNDYVVIAKGNHLQHFINGVQTVDVTDERVGKGAKEGVLALQLHAGEPMTVQFKNIRIKDLSGKKTAQTDLEAFQGDWVLAELTVNGESLDEDTRSKVRVKIDGEKYKVDNGDGDGDEGTFKLNTLTTPKWIDGIDKNGKPVQGIYELGENEIRVCYAAEGSDRPAVFNSKADSGRIFAIYRRQK
jgi:uncharacterized protein (TIGR03067 family)